MDHNRETQQIEIMPKSTEVMEDYNDSPLR